MAETTNEELVIKAPIIDRLNIWKTASELVQPIIEEHGLEMYTQGPMFGHVSRYTPVDQHIDQIIRVANWLLEKEC